MQQLPYLKHQILSLYQQLSNFSDLKPTPEVNQAFTQLIKLILACPQTIAAQLLEDPKIQSIIPQLRVLCSNGESLLEAFWAQAIIASPDPSRTLKQFTYYDNYFKLTHLEYHATHLTNPNRIKRVLFIGSGPLPLSSILLAQHYGLAVHNLDNNPAAITLSSQLLKRLDLTKHITVQAADAKTFTSYHHYDAIFLASLVGLEATQKQSIISTIKRQISPGSRLIVRTAQNLRTLIYPPVDLDQLSADLAPQTIVHPLNEIVNSVVILEKSSSSGEKS